MTVSLTEIQFFQIEANEKRTHTNKSMMLKMFYLCGFVRWTKCIWWAIENNYLLVCKHFEFVIEWIPAIRNKAEVILSSKNHLHTAIADNLGSIFSWNPQRKREKANRQLYENQTVLQRCNLPFLLSRTFETIFRKLSILSKIWKWRI